MNGSVKWSSRFVRGGIVDAWGALRRSERVLFENTAAAGCNVGKKRALVRVQVQGREDEPLTLWADGAGGWAESPSTQLIWQEINHSSEVIPFATCSVSRERESERNL